MENCIGQTAGRGNFDKTLGWFTGAGWGVRCYGSTVCCSRLACPCAIIYIPLFFWLMLPPVEDDPKEIPRICHLSPRQTVLFGCWHEISNTPTELYQLKQAHLGGPPKPKCGFCQLSQLWRFLLLIFVMAYSCTQIPLLIPVHTLDKIMMS